MPKALTERQREAVDAPAGPVRVFAGAGSGKTTVLTMRYAKLLRSGADGRRIMVCTFSKAAATEMRERLEAGVGIQLPKYAWIGTIHACFYRILREEVGEELRVLTDSGFKDKRTGKWSDGRLTILTRLIRDRNLEGAHAIETRRLLALYDRWRMSLVRAEDVQAWVDLYQEQRALGDTTPLSDVDDIIPGTFFEFYEPGEDSHEESGRMWSVFRDVADLYRAFQIEKADLKLVDFSDLIFQLWDMLDRNPQMREKWASRFDHILVDEFQDVDRCQFRVLEWLVSKSKSLFVVGDDDQAIYAFRGATPEVMINFHRHFQGARTVLLDENFRCPTNVISMANAGISNNKVREPKLFHGAKEAVNPEFIECEERDEGVVVAEYASQLLLAGAKHSDIVVVYRTNAQSCRFETAFLDKEIPYEIKNGRSFFDSTAVTDLVCYLELVAGEFSPDAAARIMNKPNRWVSRKAIGAWRAENPCLQGMRFVDGLNDLEQRAMRKLFSDIRNVQLLVAETKGNIRSALEEVLRQIDYVSWAKEHLQDDPQDDDLEATLNALRVECDAHPVPTDFFRHVRDQRANAQRQRGKQGTGVLFSTFHGVKGLEWPHVILTGMSDRWMPHRRARSARAQEEERRLAHVGLTRTQKTVCITVPGDESIFVSEWKTALPSGSPLPNLSPA